MIERCPFAVVDYLPEWCFGKELRMQEGVLLHHTSAVGVDPSRPYDYGLIRGIYEKYKVSAHFQIGREGQLYQLVSLTHEAWHAGRSIFKEREYCNKFMFGIELEATPDAEFPLAQYAMAAKVINWLQDTFTFGDDMIGTHRVVRKAWNDKYPTRQAPAKFDPNSNFSMRKLLQVKTNPTYIV